MSLLLQLVRHWRMIVRDTPRGERLGLAIGYARVKWLAKVHRPGPVSIRVCGLSIRGLDPGLLALLIEEIVIRREYFFETTNPEPVVIDCGSNVGVSVLWQKHVHPGARITAFEPDPDAFSLLVRNVSANHLDGVVLVQKAVGASDGRSSFQVDPERPGSLVGSIQERAGLRSGAEVEVTRLSTYVEGPVDFLKLDIEGSEGDVLAELATAGKLGFVEQMVIEYHHHLHPESDKLSDVLALLETHGFGYQIASQQRLPTAPRASQDVLVYAYKKNQPVGL